MKIITLEGLPLVGKSTIGKQLCQYLNSNSKTCIYRHAQITKSKVAQISIKKGFDCLSKWDYLNNEPIHDFIKYRYEQIFNDYKEFEKSQDQYAELDYIILDRYISGINIMSDIFQYRMPTYDLKEYYNFLCKEFLITSDYAERKDRAFKRKHTNNFTIYSTQNLSINDSIQMYHKRYFQQNEFGCVISNNNFEAFDNILDYINCRNM